MMNADLFGVIEWSRPWLAPFKPMAEPILRADNWRMALNDAAKALDLHNHRGLPIQFVSQSELPSGMAYEAFISATGAVPTRENLHDFFNALVWLSFPQTKIRLNALQSAALEASSQVEPTSHARRGPLRDAATIFDENAALLVSRDVSLVEELREHDWNRAWVTRRSDFARHCETWLFGHALMEKLVTPFKSITAHSWVVLVDDCFFEMEKDARRCWLDVAVAQALASGLKTADFNPLPILGIPGWWEGQDEAFYADTAVFRPKRKHSFPNKL